MGIWFEKILDSIYPKLPVCVGCLKLIETGFICDECFLEISFNKSLSNKEFEDFNAYYACYYSGAIKNIIYNFKVYKNFYCGEYLGKILIDYIKRINLKFDYITYVSRDKLKIKKEGFDQSYFLAKIISKDLMVPLIKVVYCKGKKYDQKKINSYERTLNIKGKFFIDKDFKKIKNKSVLIIDDVATTYSTLQEVCKVIKNSDIKTNISVLTIAKTLI